MLDSLILYVKTSSPFFSSIFFFSIVSPPPFPSPYSPLIHGSKCMSVHNGSMGKPEQSLGIIFYGSPFYLPQDKLEHTGSSLWARVAHQCALGIPMSSHCYMYIKFELEAWESMPGFWCGVLGVWTQVLMFAEQELFPKKPPPTQSVTFLWISWVSQAYVIVS